MTNSTDNAQILKNWSAACSQCLGAVYDICRPYHEPECHCLHPKVRFITAQLAISCHLTSESTFILVSNRKIWDADILVRSVMEGTLKYLFILQGSIDEQLQKSCEYWERLPDFAVLKRQHRATKLLEEVAKDTNASEWEPIRDILVSKDKLDRISATTSGKNRLRLAQKWSFSEVAKHFATHENKKYHGIGCLAYSYGMQSHIIHQDGDGVGMIWERNRREVERRDAIELAHGGRVISDLCHFGLIRAHEILTACQANTKPVQDIADGYGKLFNSIHEADAQWRRIEYGRESTGQKDNLPVPSPL
jgi:hypothetical protein